MYVIARKAKGTDVYAEFAYVPFVDFKPEQVQWYGTANQPMVTMIQHFQRRGVLSLFARHPKTFERCDLVELDKVN